MCVLDIGIVGLPSCEQEKIHIFTLRWNGLWNVHAMHQALENTLVNIQLKAINVYYWLQLEFTVYLVNGKVWSCVHNAELL